jgi:hypothetical protein
MKRQEQESCSCTPSGFPELSFETTLSHMARPDEFREDGMLVGHAPVFTREQNRFRSMRCAHTVVYDAWRLAAGRALLRLGAG